MRLLVGLGNPGRQYEKTRHNVGFSALNTLAERNAIQIERKRFSSLIGRGRIKGVDVLLAMPQTFMNLSGEAVRPIFDYFKINLEALLVLHDEMDVEFGRIKIATRGGAGGHKGVASIIGHLGTNEFARMKIGVGRPGNERPAESYVLGRFNDSEKESVNQVLENAAEAAEIFVVQGVAEAPAQYNRRNIMMKEEV